MTRRDWERAGKVGQINLTAGPRGLVLCKTSSEKGLPLRRQLRRLLLFYGMNSALLTVHQEQADPYFKKR